MDQLPDKRGRVTTSAGLVWAILRRPYRLFAYAVKLGARGFGVMRSSSGWPAWSAVLLGVLVLGACERDQDSGDDGGDADRPAPRPAVACKPVEEVEVPEASALPGVVLAQEGGEEGAGAEAAHAEEEAHKVLIPFFRAPNADLNMTLAMALLTFTVVQVAGISAHGVGGRIKHMADPAFLFPIEVISELSRIISLSARLFGNVFAGEVLLAVMYAMAAAVRIAIIPLAVPVVFLFLELLFGAIQALVFALLTLIYITLATAGGHDEEAREAHVEGAHGLGNVPAGAAD